MDYFPTWSARLRTPQEKKRLYKDFREQGHDKLLCRRYSGLTKHEDDYGPLERYRPEWSLNAIRAREKLQPFKFDSRRKR
jgi:hypothetical protein